MYEFSSTQFNLPPGLSRYVIDFARDLPDALLVEEGRETQPHITVQWGLRDDRVGPIRYAVQGITPVAFALGLTAVFNTPEADVLYVSVTSPGLDGLRRKIQRATEHIVEHHAYTPHVTIAYLAPGSATPYVGQDTFVGLRGVIDRFVHCSREGIQSPVRFAPTASVTSPKGPNPRTRF